MRRPLLLIALVVLGACGPKAAVALRAAAPSPDTYQTFVIAADRSPEDRALDAGRHPAQLLAFMGLQPNMKVGELFSGTGYTTELLARAVAPNGIVYGQNSPAILQRFAEGPWAERLQKPAMAHVRRLDRDFDAPFPADVSQLDVVVNVLNYHDTVWMQVDRAKMNQAIYAALKAGGVYVVVDNSSRQGAGVTEAESLHRIEQVSVIQEINAAGFRLDGEADFLRNPQDARDWNASPRVSGERRGTSDRFVLKFLK